jgi:hypothetical protein
MLSEFQQVARSLEEFGLTPPCRRHWVKPLERGEFLIASIDENAAVKKIELCEAVRAREVFKIQKDKHKSFPATKFETPLFAVSANDPVRMKLADADLSGAERALHLDAACKPHALSIGKSDRRSLKRRLQEFARELAAMTVSEQNIAMTRVLAAVTKNDIDPEQFLNQVARAIVDAVRRGDDLRIAIRALMGGVDKHGNVKSGKMTLVLDAAREPDEDFRRLAHAGYETIYHSVLLSAGTRAADGVCALTGRAGSIVRVLADPRLPLLKDTNLFSMNRETPCHDRYGLIGADICPVASDTSEELNSAALWITDARRKGKTWAAVPGPGDKNDLLIAYVEQLPDLDADIAELLSEATAEQLEGDFEGKAESVVRALEGQPRISDGAILHTLVLRRISKGQVQVELNRRYRIGRIRAAAEEWRAAAANAPPFHLYVPVGRGKPAQPIRPRPLFPAEVSRLLKAAWIRNGEDRQKSSGCDLGESYDLFLGEGIESYTAAERLMSAVLNQYSGLLLRAGEQVNRYGLLAKDLNANARKPAVMASTLLGILLYKLNRTKERYMTDAPFLVGRLLSLADVLHAQYCKAVRGGDLPPQLLGNQHYQMAKDRPARALDVLGGRLRVYKAWADTAKPSDPEGNDPVKLAGWAVAQMAQIADELHGNVPDHGFDYRGQAEMLLGYLSRGKADREKGNSNND